jgi:glycerol kinase
MSKYLLGIDQGTSSTRAIVFNELGVPVEIAQEEYDQHFPQEGWVEQNPEDLWNTTLSTCQQVCQKLSINASDIAAIGISNQRETTLLWDKNTGEVVYPAIGWQDSRMSEFCQQHSKQMNSKINQKTGLLLDPYFSATKLMWLLDNVPQARERAEKGELLFGTVDSFLLWRLSDGAEHKTDATNASRTLLFNIHTQQWDEELLKFFNIPAALLPTVVDSSGEFGKTKADIFNGEVLIAGMVGDQQGALIGQACFTSGMAKSTYGTGAFIVANTGSKAVYGKDVFLTTVAYRLQGKVTYAIEGSIFVAGSSIKWLRDKLHLLKSADDCASYATQANADSQVYLVPSFAGMGTPYWRPDARAGLVGMTLDTGIAEIVKATLESSAYRTLDVLLAFKELSEQDIECLRIDGGMVVNDWFNQFLSDLLNIAVERPKVTETSVLGAIYLAGLHVGIFDSLEHISKLWQCNKRFQSAMGKEKRERLYNGWQAAVHKVLA